MRTQLYLKTCGTIIQSEHLWVCTKMLSLHPREVAHLVGNTGLATDPSLTDPSLTDPSLTDPSLTNPSTQAYLIYCTKPPVHWGKTFCMGLQKILSFTV